MINVSSKDLISPPKDQRDQYAWLNLTIIKNSQAHGYTKDYFK